MAETNGSRGPTLLERYQGALLGLACGDAVGTAAEFKPRGSFPEVTGMHGGGAFGLVPGQWTDDTSMALCLAASLVECRAFDVRDQMRRYVAWWTHGYMSATGQCFDIGTTTRAALERFTHTGNPYAGTTDARSAGNGSLMRLAPVALYFHPDVDQVVHHASESSRTTHGAAEAVEACRLMGYLLSRALSGVPKQQVLDGALAHVEQPSIRRIARGEYLHKPGHAIRGTGYVVESLEAALWCVAHHDTYAEAVLAAANLGDDADTTAAIAGQLAGALYGVRQIPEPWLDVLHMRDEITNLADGLYRAAMPD